MFLEHRDIEYDGCQIEFDITNPDSLYSQAKCINPHCKSHGSRFSELGGYSYGFHAQNERDRLPSNFGVSQERMKKIPHDELINFKKNTTKDNNLQDYLAWRDNNFEQRFIQDDMFSKDFKKFKNTQKQND